MIRVLIGMNKYEHIQPIHYTLYSRLRYVILTIVTPQKRGVTKHYTLLEPE